MFTKRTDFVICEHSGLLSIDTRISSASSPYSNGCLTGARCRVGQRETLTVVRDPQDEFLCRNVTICPVFHAQLNFIEWRRVTGDTFPTAVKIVGRNAQKVGLICQTGSIECIVS